MAKKKNKKRVEKKPLSPAEKKANLLISAIIIVVLALAVIAAAPTIKENIAANKLENTEMAKQTAETIGQVSELLGVSVDEFIEKYGITAEGVGAETLVTDIVDGMLLEKYVNFVNDYQGGTTSFQDFIAQYGIPAEGLTPETTVKEAFDTIPISFVLGQYELDTDFATLKAEAGLGDDVTENTPFTQVQDKLVPVIEAHVVQPSEAPADAAVEAPAAE